MQKRGILLSILSGILLGISQPLIIESGGKPVALDSSGMTGYLALIAYIPVLLAMHQSTAKQAYKYGFIATFIQMFITVYWLTVAMSVFGHIPIVISYLLLALLAAVLASIIGAGFSLARRLEDKLGIPLWLSFAITLTGVEMFRTIAPFGGFPWGNVGMAMATLPTLRQAAAIVGVNGLIFLIGLSNGALAGMISVVKQEGWQAFWKNPAYQIQKTGFVVFLITMFAWVGYGTVRINGPRNLEKKVRVGILQGNVEQGIKNNTKQYAGKILRDYHELQEKAVSAGAELIVWPESALPAVVRSNEKKPSIVVAKDTPPEKIPTASVVGAVVIEEDSDKMKHYNAALFLDNNLEIRGRTAKTHLVPFGEYVPWPLRSIVAKIVPGVGTTPGESLDPVTLQTKNGPINVGATICYEGIFSDITRAIVNNGAELMVNITNDAWYGVSSAATQHLLMYSLRAIESGRPVVRAANTGISAWVDIYGEVHEPSEMYTKKAIVTDVPLEKTDTVFLRIGDVLAQLSFLIMVFGGIWSTIGRRFSLDGIAQGPKIIGIASISLAAIHAFVLLIYPTGLHMNEAVATQAMLAMLGGAFLATYAWGDFFNHRKMLLTIAVAGLISALGALWAGMQGVSAAFVEVVPLFLIAAMAGWLRTRRDAL